MTSSGRAVLEEKNVELCEGDWRLNIELCIDDWRFFEEIARKVLSAINPDKIKIPIDYYYGYSSFARKIEIGEPGKTDSINSLKEKEVKKFYTCLSYIQFQCGQQTLEYKVIGDEIGTGYHVRLQYETESIKRFVSLVKPKNDSFIENCIKEYFTQFNSFLIFTKKIMEKLSFPSHKLWLRLNDQGKFIIDISIEFENIEQKTELYKWFKDTFSIQPKPWPDSDEYCCYVLLDEVTPPSLSDEEQKQMNEVVSLESQLNQFYYQIDLILDFTKRLEKLPLSEDAREKAEKEAEVKAKQKTNELEQYRDILPEITKRAAENAEEKPLSYAIKCGGNLYLITKLISLGCEVLPSELDTLISDAQSYSTLSVVQYLEQQRKTYSPGASNVRPLFSDILTPPAVHPIEKTTHATTQNQNLPTSNSMSLSKK